MHEHHRRALNRLAEVMRQDLVIVALITSGSIAQGRAKESSDIDVFIVLTDKAFQQRKQADQLSYFNREVCDYDGGYIDGKMVNVRFLELAAERGSEPTRATFIGSAVVFSRLPNIVKLIATIPVYPELNRERNMRDFYGQIYLYGFYFASEASKKNNTYLMYHAAN